MNEYLMGIALSLSALTVTAAQARSPANLIPNPGFEKGLSGWQTAGGAEFAADQTVRHAGKSSARITVAPANKLEFQSISCTVPVKPGEAYRGRLWVRCAEPTDAGGAYGALEFLDGEKRVGIVHTDLPSNRLSPNSWQPLEAWAVVPERATSLRILCVFNSHGSAWFDDVELTRVENAPDPDRTSVKLTLRPDLSRLVSQAGLAAQAPESFPENKSQKTDQYVSLDALRFLMPYRADRKITASQELTSLAQARGSLPEQCTPACSGGRSLPRVSTLCLLVPLRQTLCSSNFSSDR
jgi:hypothetical protein